MFRNAFILFTSLLLIVSVAAAKSKELQIYSIDVEGGQATLIVSPSDESILIDTGWPGDRDAGRIVAAAKLAKLDHIDYVWITHYHRDHVGGAPALANLIKIGTFVDHGPNLEDSDVTREDFAAYEKAFAKSKRMSLKAGDGIPMKGLTVRVLTAAGEHITRALPRMGEANPNCNAEPRPPADATENPRSMGTLITFGKFRFLDLGDLTKDKELELVCPNNLIGTVDLFMVTHHGFNQSNSKAFVWAIHPRVAIMNNGAHKGASPDAWQIVRNSPGLEDLWQLHYGVDGGKDHNVSENLIANLESGPDGNYVKVTAKADGSFTVMNSRNGEKKTYNKK
jgi:competence protein ComEC